jgi:nucleoside 2-deoxyribosyltransferase
MNKRQVVYVAGPYRSKRGLFYVDRNIREARAWAVGLWRKYFAVICPHMNTAFMDGYDGMSDSTWLEGDFEIIKRCDILFVVPNWEDSEGTKMEIETAMAAKIPVYELELIEDWSAFPKKYKAMDKETFDEKVKEHNKFVERWKKDHNGVWEGF